MEDCALRMIGTTFQDRTSFCTDNKLEGMGNEATTFSNELKDMGEKTTNNA